MTKTVTNPKVDGFLRAAKKWQEEMREVRRIILDFHLVEELKWGKPCYTLDGANIVLIHAFKEYCAVLFLKGALLKSGRDALIQQTENVQSARQMRFTSVQQVRDLEPTLRDCVAEAIAVEKAGLKVELKKTSDFAMPEEFARKLKSSPALKTAFAVLTPGRQRAYLLHFASAKQSKTREARIEKCAPQILQGKGLDD